jgi:hypothetical protein
MNDIKNNPAKGLFFVLLAWQSSFRTFTWLEELPDPAAREFITIILSGWFWHTDKSFMTRGEKERGLAAYDFSQSTCKCVRKKLLPLMLPKYQYLL